MAIFLRWVSIVVYRPLRGMSNLGLPLGGTRILRVIGMGNGLGGDRSRSGHGDGER